MRAGYNKSVTTDPERILGEQIAEDCSAFKIGNRSTSTDVLLVRIPNLHGSEYFPIFPGGEEIFETERVNAIDEVWVKSEGDSTIDFGVVKRSM